ILGRLKPSLRVLVDQSKRIADTLVRILIRNNVLGASDRFPSEVRQDKRCDCGRSGGCGCELRPPGVLNGESPRNLINNDVTHR
ncbi:MAG: hypothetical protein WCB99_04100, partial [Candidatus Cybelea sp.]